MKLQFKRLPSMTPFLRVADPLNFLLSLSQPYLLPLIAAPYFIQTATLFGFQKVCTVVKYLPQILFISRMSWHLSRNGLQRPRFAPPSLPIELVRCPYRHLPLLRTLNPHHSALAQSLRPTQSRLPPTFPMFRLHAAAQHLLVSHPSAPQLQ